MDVKQELSPQELERFKLHQMKAEAVRWALFEHVERYRADILAEARLKLAEQGIHVEEVELDPTLEINT